MLNKNNIKQIYVLSLCFFFFVIDNYDSNIVVVNNSVIEYSSNHGNQLLLNKLLCKTPKKRYRRLGAHCSGRT